MYTEYIFTKVLCIDTLVLMGGVVLNSLERCCSSPTGTAGRALKQRELFELWKRKWVENYCYLRLQQPQLAGAGDSFRASLYLQLVEDSPVMPLDRVQGEEESFADLVV